MWTSACQLPNIVADGQLPMWIVYLYLSAWEYFVLNIQAASFSVVHYKIWITFAEHSSQQSLANQIFSLFLTVWIETEPIFLFLYHPQPLQVQIIKETEDKLSKEKIWRRTRGEKTRSCPILKQPVKTYISPIKENLSSNQADAEKTVTDLKPEVCAYSTALTKHTSQRCS